MLIIYQQVQFQNLTIHCYNPNIQIARLQDCYFLFLLSIPLFLDSFFTKLDPGPTPYCIDDGAWGGAGEGTGGGTFEAAAAEDGKAGGAAAAEGAAADSGSGFGSMCFNRLFL